MPLLSQNAGLKLKCLNGRFIFYKRRAFLFNTKLVSVKWLYIIRIGGQLCKIQLSQTIGLSFAQNLCDCYGMCNDGDSPTKIYLLQTVDVCYIIYIISYLANKGKHIILLKNIQKLFYIVSIVLLKNILSDSLIQESVLICVKFFLIYIFLGLFAQLIVYCFSYRKFQYNSSFFVYLTRHVYFN